jgi:integral membrane protein
MTILTTTRIISALEGISTLVLFGVAMPLKYAYSVPMAVSIVGPIHGALFIMMLILLALVTKHYHLSLKVWIWGFLAALVPIGPFIFDRYLCRRVKEK